MQTQSIDFIISSGVIDYTSSDDQTDLTQNISYTGHKGDVFTRMYNFSNTEHPFNGILHMEEIITKPNGSIPANSLSHLQILEIKLVVDKVTR